MKNVEKTAILLVLGLLGGCAGTMKIKEIGKAENWVGPASLTPCGADGRNVIKINHSRVETFRHKATGLQFTVNVVESSEDQPCTPQAGVAASTFSATLPLPEVPGGRVRKPGEKLNNEKTPEAPK